MKKINEYHRFYNFRILSVCIFCFLAVSLSAQRHKRHIDSPLEDTTFTGRTSFNGYPFVFYTPEVELAGGAGGIFIFYTAKDSIILPSKIGFAGWYSTNHQYKISINPIFYFFKNKVYFKAPTSYGHFVDKFWGIGHNIPDTGMVDYTRDVFNTTFTLQVPPVWFSADRTGLIVDYDYTEIVDKKENELLLGDLVTGSNGGRLVGFGTDLVWDSRDHIFFPTKGGYQYFKILVYPDGTSDYKFVSFEMDVRHYRAFKPDHVIAGNFYVAGVSGETPFYKLPSLSKLRGYHAGRYRDKMCALLQMEYRQYFWKRLGFAVFGGAGNVTDELMNFSFSDLKYNYGAGLRFLFNKKEKVNLRLDFGFGNDGSRGVYMAIEEAF